MLTTISNRIDKYKKPVFKTISNNSVLSTMIFNPIEMSFYFIYKALNIDHYKVSSYESSRYSNCIHNHRSGYNVFDIFSSDLLKISNQYIR